VAAGRDRLGLFPGPASWPSIETCHDWAAWRPKEWFWWIVLANLAGSVAFSIFTVAAYVNPVIGQVRNIQRANT
jgi:hypothetical protein